MHGAIAVIVLLGIVLLGWAIVNIGSLIMAFVMGAFACLIAVAYLHSKPKPPKQ